MGSNRLKTVVLSAIAVMGLIGSVATGPLTVGAESDPPLSAALGIAPRKNYAVEPGKEIKDTVRIKNIDNDSDLELSLRVIDFTYTDETGTPKLLLDADEPQTTWSLKPYLNVPETVRIPASGSKSVDISLKMPAGHGAGSYYSAIIYSTGAPGDVVGLNASGVTLVFADVPGKVKEKLTLEKLGVYRKAAPGQDAGYDFITTKNPTMIGYTLKNDGNVTEAPVGSITLKGLFGHERVIDDINPNRLLALIGQTRTFTTCIEPKSQKVEFDGAKTDAIQCGAASLWPGYYKVNLEAYYGQNGNMTQEVIGVSSFWYLPIWFLAIVLVLILAIGFGVYRIRQRSSSPKRRRRR